MAERGDTGTVAGANTVVCRGIRGATTAESNTAEDILEATRDLVITLRHLNDLRPDDIASVVFTTTPDLTATFPALAAREVGWTEVPLLCAHEMAVPGSLQKAVRVLLHVNTTRTASEIRHVYLKDARQLRPEWGIPDDEVSTIVHAHESHLSQQPSADSPATLTAVSRQPVAP